ncbi:cap-specific mRNA (nucleoside-2'-O-)-methyltransferase 1 [Toxorhynchites rutilus septentrionalis]|uniref:cap-specific mRNA (nucleoside-2'-O-)-methyltransferase 1 n=1 Tax=Toxorhynchites rutilus septentrionalis TaxID=329112 RepID=UPI00247A1A21|nr:cap-specific mRNA (nucleoside-2'-O-)-methyltransferase 1 [Toxorhynchites rutilus septentrionalis]
MSSSESESEQSTQSYGFESFNKDMHSNETKSSSDEDQSSENENDFQSKPKKLCTENVTKGPKTFLSPAKTDSNAYFSEQSRRMMEKMNYDRTKGLGKSGQGRLNIVEISTQKGRSGLGYDNLKLDATSSCWDDSMEQLNIPENVNWMENHEAAINIYRDTLESWVKRGHPKLTIDDETTFCDEVILKQILENKSAFDKLLPRDLRGARARSNPFETIKSNIFMNRAAVKMANIDAMFDYMFSNPTDECGNAMVRENDLLYFADVCAGPGGFSEYMLWRKKWHAKGFGFTLRGENDFKLHDFIAGSAETFDPYYGPKDDGNIFDPTNIESFTDYVMKQTESGVHIMMADGGFSVEGQENIQEILSKQLYLCQILVALNIVRTGGHFVVKLFDLFTPFSVGLLYLVYKCFRKICICKPNTSRPANSERYLVCKWKIPGTDTIQRHLSDINSLLFNKKGKGDDVLELVPYDVLMGDHAFFQYICDSNNEIGKNQIVGLAKIAHFCADSNLHEEKQGEIKTRCLSLWKLEDNIRRMDSRLAPDLYVDELLGQWKHEKVFLASAEKLLNGSKIGSMFCSLHDWYFVPLSNAENSGKNTRSFFLGRGGKEIMQYDLAQRRWIPVKDVHLEFFPRTLVYGEIVKEMQGEGKKQTHIHAFHIIDAIIIGGEDVRKQPLHERLRICEKYAKALNKPYRTIENSDTTYTATMPVRCKKMFALKDIECFFDRLEKHEIKGGDERLGYTVRNSNEPDRFYVPRALLFLSGTRDDYLKMFSKRANKFYYFHKQQKTSLFPEQMKCTEETIASFKNTFVHRVIWKWQERPQVFDEDEIKNITKEPHLIYRIDIRHFLTNNNCN